MERNRARAFEKLEEALDQFVNKEESVAAQVKRIEKLRKERTEAKRKKRREERLGIGRDEAVIVAGLDQDNDSNEDQSSNVDCESSDNKLELDLLHEGDNNSKANNKATSDDKE